MTAELHSFQPEEVMAYLDGEVTGERALALADHLEHCAECSSIADDFCALSQQLVAWRIESSPLVKPRALLGMGAFAADEAMGSSEFEHESEAMPAPQSAAPAAYKGSVLLSILDFILRPRLQRPWVWALASACAVMLIVSSRTLMKQDSTPSHPQPANVEYQTAPPQEHKSTSRYVVRSLEQPTGNTAPVGASRQPKTQSAARDLAPALGPAPSSGLNVGGARARGNMVSVDGADAIDNSINGVRAKSSNEASSATKIDNLPHSGRNYLTFTLRNSQSTRDNAPSIDAVPESLRGSAGPMIEKTASLSLVVNEMDAARASLEGIAKGHHGYFGEMNATGQSTAARTLTASLRVPAGELDDTLVELRKLGHLDEEQQGGEEVSQQHVDLEARLKNARKTEGRLTDLLTKRAENLKDVLDVERELASTREDIERMEAQARNLESQVKYASIELKLREEYKPALNLTPPATRARLRNALVNGYGLAVESALGLVLFLFEQGPTILFWLLLIFFPSRWAWRKLRAATVPQQSLAGVL